MKPAIYITLLMILSGAAFAQKAGTKVVCDDKKLKSDPCGLFSCFASEHMYNEAYGLMVQGKIDNCSGSEFLLLQARVLAANNQFDQALFVLKDFKAKYADDQLYDFEYSRLMEVWEHHKHPLPLELIVLSDVNTNSNEMVGWVDSEAPIVLTDNPGHFNHFPTKRVMDHGYSITEQPGKSTSKIQKTIAKKIESQEYFHLGPGHLVSDSILYFTAVEGNPYSLKEKSGKLKIFQSLLGQKVDKPEELGICLEGYNDGYPVYNPKSKTIYFSSDRPGGSGGMDIWFSKFENKEWSEPKPVDGGINSEWNELFPELLADTLFFSSDRVDLGLGGSDIYGFDINSKHVWNLGSPVNSPQDDFRMVFVGPNEAFIVSNRASAMAGDNVFKIKWSRKELFFEELIGGAEWLSASAGKQVILIDKVTLARQTTIIGKDGKFHFYNVKGQSDFELQFPDVEMQKGDKLDIFSGDGNLVKELVSKGGSTFNFELLTPMDYFLEELENSSNSEMSAAVIKKLLESGTKQYRDMRIFIKDRKGNNLGQANSSDDGLLVFTPSENGKGYVIKSEVLMSNDTVFIIDSKGNLVKTIGPDEESNGIELELESWQDELLFTNQYQRSMPWENLDSHSVYFGFDKYVFNAESEDVLRKVALLLLENKDIHIEIIGHTDSRGSQEYNHSLSLKRVESVKDYLSKSGIEETRMSGIGKGETKPRNHCGDQIRCTKDEYAENRRVEFSFSTGNLVSGLPN